MQHPACCRYPRRVYGHLVVYEPQAERLGKKDHDCSKYQLDGHSCRIDFVQLRIRALAHLEGYESRDCGIQRPGYYGEHGHDASHDIIYAEVVLSEGSQDNTRGV